MNIEEAKVELSFHSGRNPNTDDPRWVSYFLGSLRPYKGMQLVEDNFHKIIECLDAVTPSLQNDSDVDRNLASDIAGILCLGKAWAVHKEGMLLSNKLISNSESERIDGWLDCISYAWMMLLDSQDKSLAFEAYNEQYKI